jgi:hypothetical protein
MLDASDSDYNSCEANSEDDDSIYGNEGYDEDSIGEEEVHCVDSTIFHHDQVATGRNYDSVAISNMSNSAINAIGSICQGTIETAVKVSKRLHNPKGYKTHYHSCFTVEEKVFIAREAMKFDLRPTCRKYRLKHNNNVREWTKTLPKLIEKMLQKPTAKTCNKGPKIKHPDLEDRVYDWAKERRMDDIPITTANGIHTTYAIAEEYNISFL